MKASVFTLALLSGSALAAQLQFRSTFHDFGAMLRRGDAIAKRQGYTPSTRLCGSGNDCEEACGKGQVQCDSNVGLYCHDSTDGSHCCPDRSGNSCNKDYICTSDKVGATYCCPEGQDLKECAKAYNVDSLQRQSVIAAPTDTSSPTPAPILSSGFPVMDPDDILSTFVNRSSTQPPKTTPPASQTSSSPSSSSASAPSSEFTGAAGKVAGAGMAVLAAGAGMFL